MSCIAFHWKMFDSVLLLLVMLSNTEEGQGVLHSKSVLLLSSVVLSDAEVLLSSLVVHHWPYCISFISREVFQTLGGVLNFVLFFSLAYCILSHQKMF